MPKDAERTFFAHSIINIGQISAAAAKCFLCAITRLLDTMHSPTDIGIHDSCRSVADERFHVLLALRSAPGFRNTDDTDSRSMVDESALL